LKFFLRLKEKSLIQHYKSPLNLQEKTFNSLISLGAGTEFGKKYNFCNIKTPKQFAESVPLHKYEDLLPYFQKVLIGKTSVLWPGKVNWFAKSSGSTDDRSKYIPVSREALYQCHFKAAQDVIAFYFIHKPFSKIFSGKGFILGGSTSLHPKSRTIRAGDLSAVLLHSAPFISRLLRFPQNSVALHDNWTRKMELLVQLLPKQNITSISGVPSWMLVLLEKILESQKENIISSIWPNLELFIHGAVNFDPYRQRFKEIFEGLDVYFLETYNASEGFFAIQDLPAKGELLLLLDHGIFYEFIPLQELNSDHPTSYHLGEVKEGVNYAMVISTNGGLWRYLIGDTIKFTSLHPFRIKITGRTKHFINVFGEELMVENAETAITHTCKICDAMVRDFTAGPVFMSGGKAGAHEWYIEFNREPFDMSLFSKVLDEELRKINSDYDAKRLGNLALGPPIVHRVPKGTFDRWLMQKNRLGGQHKVPRLSNERNIIEEIREIL